MDYEDYNLSIRDIEVLSALEDRELTPWEIQDRIGSDEIFLLSSILVSLNRLEKYSLVEWRWEERIDDKARHKYYRITEGGLFIVSRQSPFLYGDGIVYE